MSSQVRACNDNLNFIKREHEQTSYLLHRLLSVLVEVENSRILCIEASVDAVSMSIQMTIALEDLEQISKIWKGFFLFCNKNLGLFSDIDVTSSDLKQDEACRGHPLLSLLLISSYFWWFNFCSLLSYILLFANDMAVCCNSCGSFVCFVCIDTTCSRPWYGSWHWHRRWSRR